MATSKTLTPTNVTIQIPEFTDQPDQRVNSNCIDKEADAINALNTNLSTLATTVGNMIDLQSYASTAFNNDLNQINKTSIVEYTYGNASSISNKPGNFGAIVLTILSTNSGATWRSGIQFCTDRTTGSLSDVYIRTCIGDSFSPWKKITIT